MYTVAGSDSLRKRKLLDGLDSIYVDIDKFVGGQKRLDLWPDSRQKLVKRTLSHVSDSQMYNPGRRVRKHYPVREINVFGYDRIFMVGSMPPQKSIGSTMPQIHAMNQRKAGNNC
jgi:hypothetical protein